MADLSEKELEELAEGVANLQWLQKNGGKLLEAMLNPTWPKREVEK